MVIAVARDDTAEGTAALLHAAREAEFRQASLAVLQIVDLHEATDAARADLQDEVGRLLAAAGLNVDWALHVAGDDGSRADTLVELTRQVGADLLVVGSRRRTPIGKFLLGSTVQRVVLDAPVPVLVVKAPLTAATPGRLAASKGSAQI